MELFNIPRTAKVHKVIPKNAFDAYTSTKQKKLFSDFISRITWIYKLSPDTINLEAMVIKEIQIFKVELKFREDVQAILDIIDKAVPYHIIFILAFEESIYLSASAKHPHPVNEDKAVIDWTFRTEWFLPSENTYSLQFKKSLDEVYYDFCIQLSGKPIIINKTLQGLVQYKSQIDLLEKEIAKLQSGIVNCKQFNRKVELNMKLKTLEKQLQEIRNSV